MKTIPIIVCGLTLAGCVSPSRPHIYVEVKRYHALKSGAAPAFRIIPDTTNAWTAREIALNDVVINAVTQAGQTVDPSGTILLAWSFTEDVTSVPVQFTSYQTSRTSGSSSTTYVPTRTGLVPVITSQSPTTTTVPVRESSTVTVKHWLLHLQAFDSSKPNMPDVFTAASRVSSDQSGLTNVLSFLLRETLADFPGQPVVERSRYVDAIR